mmetsp:Transcript_41878/g.125345  ORF Transcript_41878/g.125345 Transcript_41878/m.125345 type:complete len:255 (+) Transcript_41878:2094-2858(+)
MLFQQQTRFQRKSAHDRPLTALRAPSSGKGSPPSSGNANILGTFRGSSAHVHSDGTFIKQPKAPTNNVPPQAQAMPRILPLHRRNCLSRLRRRPVSPPDEDQFGRALVDAEMLPHEVAALQKRRPVLNCKVLGAVFCFVKLERGHEDVVMLHHHVLHLLIVQPELTEVVGHDERLGRDSCNNLVLDESGHRIRRVVHDAGDDEFAKRRSHDALVKLKAHHFIVVVCVRLHGSTLLLEVDCNEDVGEVCRRAAAL